jgi:hypothetical protein
MSLNKQLDNLPKKDKKEISWLNFFIGTLFLSALLSVFFKGGSVAQVISENWGYLEVLMPFLITLILIYIFDVFGFAYAGFLLWQRKPNAVSFTKMFLLANIVVNGIITSLFWVGYSIIWLIYLLLKKLRKSCHRWGEEQLR